MAKNGDDVKPMLPDTNDGKSTKLGRIFRPKRPQSPQIKQTTNGHNIATNDSTRSVTEEKSNTNSKQTKSSNSENIFSKLSKMGKIFKSHKNDAHKRANAEINKEMEKEQRQKQRSLNILLLGAGGSGKTTVFKQMEKLYNGKIDEKQMESAREDIRRNVLNDIYDLCKYNIRLNSNNTSEDLKFKSSDLQETCFRIASWQSKYIFDSTGSQLTPELAEEIEKLWQDDAMKTTWNKRKNSHIMDNTPYFLNKIADLASTKYVATFDDFVRVRDQTTGIIHKDFIADTEFGRYKFSVTDVGGQRAERRKWMRLFDNISVVVYIMSLSAYDQHLYEDNRKNCWDETLELFYKTSHERVFDTTDWVIFFNKVDIFEKKIKIIPFTVYQENFNDLDKHNGNKVKEYIKNQFQYKFYDGLTKERKKRRGNLYFHITCATNANDVGRIIQKVQIDLIKSQMKRMGYLL